MGATVIGLPVVSCKASTSSGWAGSLPRISSPIPSSTPPACTLVVLLGRGNQTRQRRGCAIDIVLNVVGDDAQGPGLGRTDR